MSTAMATIRTHISNWHGRLRADKYWMVGGTAIIGGIYQSWIYTRYTPRNEADNVEGHALLGMAVGGMSGALLVYQPIAFAAMFCSGLVGHGVKNLEWKRQEFFNVKPPVTAEQTSFSLTVKGSSK